MSMSNHDRNKCKLVALCVSLVVQMAFSADYGRNEMVGLETNVVSLLNANELTESDVKGLVASLQKSTHGDIAVSRIGHLDSSSLAEHAITNLRNNVDRWLPCLDAPSESERLVANAILSECLISGVDSLVLDGGTDSGAFPVRYSDFSANISNVLGENRYNKLLSHYRQLFAERDNHAFHAVAARTLVMGLGDGSAVDSLERSFDSLRIDHIRSKRKDKCVERDLVSVAEALAYLQNIHGILVLERAMSEESMSLDLRINAVRALSFLGKTDMILKSKVINTKDKTLAFHVFDRLPKKAWEEAVVVRSALDWFVRIAEAVKEWTIEDKIFMSKIVDSIPVDRSLVRGCFTESEIARLTHAVLSMSKASDERAVRLASSLYFAVVSPDKVSGWMNVLKKISPASAKILLIWAIRDACPREVLALNADEIRKYLKSDVRGLRIAALAYCEKVADIPEFSFPKTDSELKARVDALLNSRIHQAK